MVTVAQPASSSVAPVLPEAAPSLTRPGTASPAAWDLATTPAELNAIHTAIFLDNLRDTHRTNHEIRKTLRVALRTVRGMSTRRIPVDEDLMAVAALAARFRPLPIPRPLTPRAPRSRSGDIPPPRTPTPPPPGPREPHPPAAEPALVRPAKDLLTAAAATSTITPAPSAGTPSSAVAPSHSSVPSSTPVSSSVSPAAPVTPAAPAAIIPTPAAAPASAPAPLPPAKAAFLAPFLREREELQAKLAAHSPEVQRLNAARLAHANAKTAEPSPAYIEANRRLEHFLRDTIHPITTRLAILADLIRDHAP